VKKAPELFYLWVKWEKLRSIKENFHKFVLQFWFFIHE
jgi:hypothetical protein